MSWNAVEVGFAGAALAALVLLVCSFRLDTTYRRPQESARHTVEAMYVAHVPPINSDHRIRSLVSHCLLTGAKYRDPLTSLRPNSAKLFGDIPDSRLSTNVTALSISQFVQTARPELISAGWKVPRDFCGER